MPGIHSPLSRHLFTIDGMVKKAGGAKMLAQGQAALVQVNKPTADGAAVVGDNMSALSPNAVLEVRVGKFQLQNPTELSGYTNKAYTSETFKLGNIRSIKSMFPKVVEQKFDSWIIGYDGLNPSSALVIPENRSSVVDIEFCGDILEYATGEKKHLAKFHIYREEDESMQEVVRRLYEDIVNYTFPGSVELTNLAEVKLVDSTAETLTGDEYVFSSLVVADQGESADLAKIQGQYPYKVEIKARDGINSTYNMLHPESYTPASYVVYEGGFIKGCEDCPAGYEELDGGFVYSVALEDDGTAQAALVQGIAGAVAGTAVKKGQHEGKGTYLVVTTAKLTQANINTFLSAGTIQSTAEIQYVGESQDLCQSDDTTTYAWVAGDSCVASEQLYRIQLRDGDCEESRLADLQAAYPDQTITEVAGENSSRTVTLTGTSGTANINIGGNAYLATFATNLSTTASNFVTAHAAALAADGITVTANAAVLTFVSTTPDVTGLTIVNATTNLAGTLGTVTAIPDTGGCQRIYEMSVITDIICEDCDPIFTELFKSEAPQPFEFVEWTKYPNETFDATALMGIKITGKPIVLKPTDLVRDWIPRYESSVRIMVAGGYLEQIDSTNVDYDQYPLLLDGTPFSVKLLSRAVDRDNLGWHLLPWEEVSRTYFSGSPRHKNNIYARQVLGEESVLKFDSQYVGYEITILDNKFSQGVGHTSNIGTSYTLWAEVGRHQELDSLVNALAAKVGLPVESALAYEV